MEPLDLHERTYGSSPISFDAVINKPTKTESHVYDVFSLALQYYMLWAGFNPQYYSFNYCMLNTEVFINRGIRVLYVLL